ncbi:hypothetical protein Pcinc_013814 [Petrolisthes cinctipes]|uniref:Uncharacterized protein n=1 Tax=Petrolisthes cinctipes TaxID=88211 RepID=A0AAE1KRA5_PETCI|nr:hypothetical protein Pcinc_013814 [Petrolisthes cinctipes]
MKRLSVRVNTEGENGQVKDAGKMAVWRDKDEQKRMDRMDKCGGEMGRMDKTGGEWGRMDKCGGEMGKDGQVWWRDGEGWTSVVERWGRMDKCGGERRMDKCGGEMGRIAKE